MKFLKVKAENFSSYNNLEFSFDDSGLALIHGATGAGKSTLMDMPCWALFGITAKDGSVDEVRSWNSPSEPTTVTLELVIQDGNVIEVTRIRGSAKQNDLFFIENGTKFRGKDLADTQELLNARLNISADLFLRAAYFSEFSPTASFFTDKAKDRKQLFEIITDLSFPINIDQRADEQKKQNKKDLAYNQSLLDRLTAKQDQLSAFIKDTVRKNESWASDRKQKIESLSIQSDKFEETKKSNIDALQFKLERWNEEHKKKLLVLKERYYVKYGEHPIDSAPCQTCGNVDPTSQIAIIKSEQLKADITRLENEVNPFIYQLDTAVASTNNFESKIQDLKGVSNPFDAQLSDLVKQKEKLTKEISLYKDKIVDMSTIINRLQELQDIVHDLKTHLLHNSIVNIQSSVNTYLQNYFDSEFTITFTVQDDSNLEVGIFKNGHECVYTQLSKGQRGLLKLVFSVAVMQAASNTSGVHFDNLFFDEPTDGTDNELKIKSYRLFEQLNKNHTSVLIIDHSDALKALFNNQYKVDLIGDSSKIYKYE